MKSNITKYLLGWLLTAVCVATAGNSYAYKMRDLVDNFNHSSSSIHTVYFSTNDSLHDQYFREWYFGSTVWGLNLQYSSFLRVSWLTRYKTVFNSSWEAVNGGYVIYPLVWFVDNWNWWITFKYFMDWDSDSYPYLENFNVPSRAWFTHTFNDWTSCLMDKVFFNAWSIIFMCSDSLRTYQILAWSYTLWNHILYVDPTNSSNNVWWIWLQEWKARSQTVSQSVRSQILYWWFEINESFITALFSSWYSSYTISPWWSNFWPTCWLYECWTQSFSDSDVWFIYSRDLQTVDPDFWWSNTTNPDDWNNIVPIWWTAYSWYLSCFQDWTEISSFANSWNDCRSQAMSSWMNLYEFMDVEDYVLNFTWDDNENWRDITDNVACQSFMLSAKIEYDQYWSDYYNHLISVAKNYKNASNSLPVEAYCGSNPLTHETNSITTREDIYWESKQANSPLSWEDCSNRFTCTLQEWIEAPKQYFYDNLIWTYSGAFHSWYNAVDFVSCPTQSYRSTNYWNYIFIAWVVFLVFIFISII